MQTLDRSTTLAQIVTDHPEAARVFLRHGMDYCCHGDVSVAEACREAPLDPEVVFAELEEALGGGGERPAPEEDPRALSGAALIARIVERYHGPARRSLARIAPILEKVVAVHGPRDARLAKLQAIFREISEAFLPHLDEEEQVLFPALLAPRPDPAVVSRELERMGGDHLLVGRQLARMRSLTSCYATPEWGCLTYHSLMSELEAFEADTLRHVHLENHVLAPLAARAR